MEELLSVYERFGSKAQEALDFARRNMKPMDGIKMTIVGVAPPENGVYERGNACVIGSNPCNR